MKKLLAALLAIVTISFSAVSAVAQKDDAYPSGHGYSPQRYVNEVLKKDATWQNAVAGVMAVDQNGKVLAKWNENLPLLTASTMKTVTTGLGLLYLGENYKFETKIAYSGSIKGGVLHGNLYIIGGGDPTLGSSDPVAYKIDSVFGVWTKAIKEAGINKIEGSIVGDDSFFEREQMPGSWCWDDLGTDYGSAPCGLAFGEDVQQIKIIPGKTVGAPARVVMGYPFTPGVKIINNVTTGPAKSGDRSGFYTSDIEPVGTFEGTVGIDRDTVKYGISNKYSYLTCGYAFHDYLVANGVSVPASVISIEEARKDDGDITPTLLTTTYSPELWKIVTVTNHISNNFYAETILKTIGKKMTGVGSYRSSLPCIHKLLKQYGVDDNGFTSADGCGLSRENYVSTAFFCRYYAMMEKQDVFQKFFESLPYPGVGTLEGVLDDIDPVVAARVHAKSGSLSSVKCYAGFVKGAGKTGLIRFAILVNNYSAPTRHMQKGLEGFMQSLAEAK
ncbi:MAG: D-alanyl-D-alanine carboxypeptidase/D-alanyl-D-alanine-endopeptidase [Bacteroidales bacterium]|jgi:D-alanyl-D-alanine carboxypeptidase/D-alanyl-D-alanine-endopeptidase (penicillin-binding protein 4)|nr:D-alanyl-D-alanine carboxypeptidase/D-alanyl-D-alanine-endopeptidase [Bacteroidales bacterium]MCI1733362.1 D-alanyl-D-alanine carboxypeptidase/D-alanyl-D-alanine-endopeptidase [Bacteroidales bacterium]